jgi:hypothetical protein
MASTAFMLTKELIEIGPQRDHLPFNGGGNEMDVAGGLAPPPAGL